MEEKIDFAKVPYQYSMCLNRQCPQAGTCLRQLTEQSVPENIEHWIIISPKYLSTVKGGPITVPVQKYDTPKDSSES